MINTLRLYSLYCSVLLLLPLFLRGQVLHYTIQSNHNIETEGMLISEDKQFAVTYTANGQYDIWNMQTWKKVQQVNAGHLLYNQSPTPYGYTFHSPPALSPDSRFLITEYHSDKAPHSGVKTDYAIWDMNTGELFREIADDINHHEVDYSLVQFHDAQTLLLHGANHTIQKYEITVKTLDGRILQQIHYRRPFAIGRDHYRFGKDDLEWRSATLAMSKDQRMIALGTNNGQIFLFRTGSRKQKELMQPEQLFIIDPDFPAKRISFSEDGKFLMASSKVRTRIWNIETGKTITYDYPFYSINIGDNGPRRLYYGAASDNCQYIYTTSFTNGIGYHTIQETLSGRIVEQFQTNEQQPEKDRLYFGYWDNSKISNDGSALFSISGRIISERKTGSGTKHNILNNLTTLTNVVFNEKTSELIVGEKYNNAFILNLSDRSPSFLRTFPYVADTLGISKEPNHEFSFEDNIIISRDSNYLLTYDVDIPQDFRCAYIWNIKTREPVDSCQEPDVHAWQTQRDILKHFRQSAKWQHLFKPISHWKRNEGLITLSNGIVITIDPYKACRFITDTGKGLVVSDYTIAANKLYAGLFDGSIMIYDVKTGNLEKCIPGSKTLHYQKNREAIYNPISKIRLSENGLYLYFIAHGKNFNEEVVKYDLAINKVINVYADQSGDLNDLILIEKNDLLITSGNSKVTFWRNSTAQLLANLYVLDKEYILITPDGFYTCSKRGNEILNIIGDKNTYSKTKLDLRYNRPDTVLTRLGIASATNLQKLQNASLVRIPTQNIADVPGAGNDQKIPELTFTCSRSGLTTRLSIQATDKFSRLKRMYVLINGVVVRKIDLPPSHKTNQEIEVELSAGRNIIDVYVVNDRNLESLRPSIDIVNEQPALKPTLYLIAVGVDRYEKLSLDRQLQFAVKDARNMTSLFSKRKTPFEQISIDTLFNEDFNLAALQRLKNKINQSGVNDCVLFYYAGHGLLHKGKFIMGTSNVDMGDPVSGVSLSDVEQLLTDIKSRNKLILLDACQSGDMLTAGIKELDVQPAFPSTTRSRETNVLYPADKEKVLAFDLMKDIFSGQPSETNNGCVVLAAARAYQEALEGDDSEGIQNGLFTYCIIEGLKQQKADRDKDGKITIYELQEYLNTVVPAKTKNKQIPVVRSENPLNDFQIW